MLCRIRCPRVSRRSARGGSDEHEPKERAPSPARSAGLGAAGLRLARARSRASASGTRETATYGVSSSSQAGIARTRRKTPGFIDISVRTRPVRPRFHPRVTSPGPTRQPAPALPLWLRADQATTGPNVPWNRRQLFRASAPAAGIAQTDRTPHAAGIDRSTSKASRHGVLRRGPGRSSGGVRPASPGR